MDSKRLSINLPAETFEELRLLATNSGRSMTEVVRTSLELAKLAHQAGKDDHFLAIAGRDGKILKHLIVV